jgi:DNA-3-methyladenine glycosylase I
MKKTKTVIRPATRGQASEIATLIMLAMNHDCCRNFAAPNHTLDDFHRMMTRLVEMDESLYSYRNTLTAVTRRGELAGICTAYDGKDFLRLRTSFVEAARQHLGRDFSTIAVETTAGEYYIDSLAVKPEYQGQGIATALLRAVINREGDRQPVGLLVDQGNPLAEKLYERIGFETVGDSTWGGHAMHHMQYPVKCAWARQDPLSEKYHDEEWGVPVHNERDHYMFLLMEAMSCGLSWRMMLQRREVFRQCFADFDARKVARFTEEDVERIMQTEGMIRSRRKIEGMITNAQAFVRVTEEFGSFDKYIWSFSNGKSLVYPSHQNEWTVSNDLSDRVAKDLKKRGFKFVGSTIIYSHLQAIGIINDHRKECFRYKQLADNGQCIINNV